MTAALLIDGENVGSAHAGAVLAAVPADAAIRRVYGDLQKLNGWAKVPELRLIHAAEGRNSADILLAIDAMAMFAAGTRDFIIVTADGGLVHLVRHLREAGCRVAVVSDSRASDALRNAGTCFVPLGLGTPQLVVEPAHASVSTGIATERGVTAFVAAAKDQGVTVTSILKFASAAYPDCPDLCGDVRQWLLWLCARPTIFRVDPPGPTARVRLVTYAHAPTP